MSRIVQLKVEDALMQYFVDRSEVTEKTLLEKLAWDALVQIQIFERLFEQLEEKKNKVAEKKSGFLDSIDSIIAEKNRYEV